MSESIDSPNRRVGPVEYLIYDYLGNTIFIAESGSYLRYNGIIYNKDREPEFSLRQTCDKVNKNSQLYWLLLPEEGIKSEYKNIKISIFYTKNMFYNRIRIIDGEGKVSTYFHDCMKG